MKSSFGFLYRGVHGVHIGLEAVAPEFARQDVEVDVRDGLAGSWTVLSRVSRKFE